MKRSTFGIAMRMLFAKKQRLILTCIGIAVSFGLIIVISTLYGSMERSVQKTLDREIGTFDMMAGYNPFEDKEGKKLLTKEEISKLRNLDGVIGSGVAIQFLELATNSAVRQTDGINYIAVEPNEIIWNFYKFTTSLQPNEMVITEEVARRWGVKLGDTKEFPMNNDIVLRKVVGEIIPNYTSGPAVLMNIDAIRQEYSLGEVANTIYLDLADGVSDKAVEATIRSEIDGNMDIALRSQNNTVMKQNIMFRFIAIGLGGILLLVSILFLSSSFKLMLLGRVRELSTFRMVGAGRRVIYKMVMMEAAVLNLLGVVLGVGVGIVLCNISTKFIDSMMGIDLNNVEMDPRVVVTIALFGWLLLTLSVMRIAVTAAAAAPLVAVRHSEEQGLNRSNAWVSGSLFVIGCVILGLAWLDLISSSARLLITLMGGLLAAGGCILGTGYIIPIVSRSSGWFIRKFAIAEAYYAVKQFSALRRQNSFIVMLLASIVTAFIAIPTFIDNLNRANVEQVMREHITPIVIEKKRDVMSSNVVEQVRQVKGVDQALPMGSFHAVLLGDMDYERADPKWLKRNSYPPEYYKKGTPLYDTFEYQWLGVAQTDFKLMQQMGLMKVDYNELPSGIVIQSEYAKHMGIALGDTVYLQRTSLGERLEQSGLPVSGVTELTFTTNETLVLVDHHNPKVSWIEDDHNYSSNEILPKTIYVQVSEGADITSVRIALQKLLEDDPLIKVTDLDSELLRSAEQSREQYTILWAVMVIFVIVGIVGVMNTLGATFHAHRREYAILRAIHLTTAKLRSVMIIQGLLYAITAIVIGIIAGSWIIIGLFSGTDEFNGWTISWFTIALPIIVIGVITLLISFLYAKQIGLNSITEELTVE
ncbi:ABC-type antimicrobial peptide transport system permease subunit [Paenibacillus sp. DS2015]|uniref:ABC transporter permease n=1 Tax=Paenibacillus sp. DS2015 TaxID=3373917 RepID=UPI003D22128F